MCRVDKALHRLARLPAAVLAACGCLGAQAQALSPNYALTAPAILAHGEAYPQSPLVFWGPVRFAAGRSSAGSGLSLEAGQSWFARAGVGHSIEGDAFSLGGGYRFGPGDAVSMMVTRQLGQERLGLAVRYDWRQAYLRLSYDQPVLRIPGPTLRFSAGVQF